LHGFAMRDSDERCMVNRLISLRRKAAVTCFDFRATKSRMSIAVHASGLAASAYQDGKRTVKVSKIQFGK